VTVQAPHALEEGRDRPRCVDLKGTLEPSDINAEFERRRRARCKETVLILHPRLRRLTECGGEIPVMNEETIRLMLFLTIAPDLAPMTGRAA